jgi:hypothetical protein
VWRRSFSPVGTLPMARTRRIAETEARSRKFADFSVRMMLEIERRDCEINSIALLWTDRARGTSMMLGENILGTKHGRQSPAPTAAAIQRLWLGLLLCGLLVACSQDTAPVVAADYAAKIVGGWEGTVGDDSETIRFDSDGKFVSEVRPRGFISNTLGQGVTGTVRGTWQIKGNAITLNVANAQDARVANTLTTSTIEKFEPNEIIVKSSRGDTSTFRRLL